MTLMFDLRVTLEGDYDVNHSWELNGRISFSLISAIRIKSKNFLTSNACCRLIRFCCLMQLTTPYLLPSIDLFD